MDIKKILIIYICFVFSMSVYCQVTIQMEKDGGVYKIPCLVNGARMKMIFDTGASTVCISMSMAEYLYDNDYLKKEDILGTGKSTVADGRIVDNIVVNLKDVEIAGMHLFNVKAIVSSSQSAPLLLGQTAIQKLGKIVIDGNRLIINNAKNKYSDEDIAEMDELAEKYYNDGMYESASEKFIELDEIVGLNEIGLYKLVDSQCKSGAYGACIQSCKKWLGEYEKNTDNINHLILVCDCMALSYENIGDLYNAIIYRQKSYSVDAGFWKYYTLINIADIYVKMKQYSKAQASYVSGIKGMCSTCGLTINSLISNSHVVCSDESKLDIIGRSLFFYAYIYMDYYDDMNKFYECLKLAAKCGYKYAIEGLQNFGREYNVSQNCYYLFE